MQCFVYASPRKPGSYVWLAARDAFDVLPESLALLLGDLRFVMEVQLDPSRRLPLEDTAAVLRSLGAVGWHLQLPPAEHLTLTGRTPSEDLQHPASGDV